MQPEEVRRDYDYRAELDPQGILLYVVLSLAKVTIVDSRSITAPITFV